MISIERSLHQGENMQEILQLVERARSGDEAALAALITRFMPAIRAAAARAVCPGLDFDDAVQEGLIALFHAAKTFDPGREASFATYANACIRNAAADAAKAAQRRKHAPLNTSVPLEEQQSAPGPEEAILEDERYVSTMRTIEEKLSARERQVLALFLLGESYGAIAKRLGVTEKAVDNALQRVRAKLR